ncbi:MAG: hypothetical protein QW632_02970 [Ignisphaera sp.]
MKASIHLNYRWMPEGTYHRVLKSEAEMPMEMQMIYPGLDNL